VDFSAGAKHLEFRGRATLEQQQVIGESAQAAEHDVFILRQSFAGFDRAAPHALDDGQVRQQRRTLDIELAKRCDHLSWRMSWRNFDWRSGRPIMN